jgi:hypothetical protein
LVQLAASSPLWYPSGQLSHAEAFAVANVPAGLKQDEHMRTDD